MTEATANYRIDRTDEGDRTVLRLTGRLRLADGDRFWRDLTSYVAKPGAYRLDLSGTEALDGASAALLLALKTDVDRGGGSMDIVGANDDVETLLSLYAARGGRPKAAPRRPGFFHQVGAAVLDLLRTTRETLGFTGDLLVSGVRALKRPRTVNWADIASLMERAGADGLPIALLINFLIGLILGLQAALQLEQFGASIYVADLVGKAHTRELGPLMTAIIVCGRSGAAYAAELGTMKVSEEVDALQTLGQDPLRYLVFPRAIALAAMTPLLTLIGDFVGCLGGLCVAVGTLDLPAIAYTNQLQDSLTLWDVGGGLIKAVVFAVTITLVSCQRGLATRGGAAGVGTSTTSAVVIILFTLVALDAAFAVVYSALGI